MKQWLPEIRWIAKGPWLRGGCLAMAMAMAMPAQAQERLQIQLQADGADGAVEVQVEEAVKQKEAAPKPPQKMTADELRKLRMQATIDRYRTAFSKRMKTIASDMVRYLELDEARAKKVPQAGEQFIKKKLTLENGRVPSGVTRLIYSQDMASLADSLSKDPLWTKAMAKVVSEKQLKDYARFAKKRSERTVAANDQYMVAWMDRYLLLSETQRQEFEKLLDKNATQIRMYFYRSRHINDAYNRLRSKPMDFMKEPQKKLWEWLVIEPRRGNRGRTTEQRASYAVDRRQRGARLFLDAALMDLNRVGKLDSKQQRHLELAAKGAYETYLENNPSGSTMEPPLETVEGGLFASAVQRTLDEEQKQSLEKITNRRRAYARRSLRQIVMQVLDTKLLLTEKQFEKVQALVEKAVGQTDPRQWTGTEVAQAIAKVDNKAMRPLLQDETQAMAWATLRTQMGARAGIQVLERFQGNIQLRAVPGVIIRQQLERR